METYGRFLYEFLNQFFSGFKEMFVGLWNGIINISYVKEVLVWAVLIIPIQLCMIRICPWI